MPGSELVQSLARGLDLLNAIAESADGLRLPELVSTTGLKRPTLHNLLRTLQSRDYVIREEGVYRLGPVVYGLVSLASSSERLGLAEQVVRRLAEELPFAIVSYSEPLAGEMLVRFRKFPNRLLMERHSGALMQPYHTASGLAMLAYADPETRQRIQLRYPFEVTGVSIWETEAALECFLAEVRDKGLVLPPFCREARFKVAAVPHVSQAGKCLGVLGAAWHVDTDDSEDQTETVMTTLQAGLAELVSAPVRVCH